MPPGRPAAKPRTVLGERIAAARKERGVTQMQLAELLGVTQRVVTYWEREPVALKPEQLCALAEALGTTADYLIGRAQPVKRGTGPEGRGRRLFEAASKLPRGQREKVYDVLESFVKDHS